MVYNRLIVNVEKTENLTIIGKKNSKSKEHEGDKISKLADIVTNENKDNWYDKRYQVSQWCSSERICLPIRRSLVPFHA